MKIFTSLTALFISTALLAGNISSGGGGELIGDAQNPWFLEAAPGEPVSPGVKYCVKAGPDFVVELPRLKELVRLTISWWDKQASSAYFAENEVRLDATNSIIIRAKFQTTRYTEVPDCTGSEDLQFLFGYLSEDQRRELKEENIDTTKFVGMTIRTDYSQKMRAKGYIYISPDRGDLAMRSPTVLPNMWLRDLSPNMKNFALMHVLRHEFGHILGVPHTLSGVMDAKAPERLTSTLFNWEYSVQLEKPIFFPGPTRFQSCDRAQHPDLFHVFNVPDTQACVGVYIDLNRVRVWMRATPTGNPMTVADQVLSDEYKRRQRALVTLTLPTVRDVFRKVPEFFRTLKSADMTEIQQTIKIIVNDRQSILSLQKDSDRFQLSANTDGKSFPDLYPEGSGWSK